MSHSLSKTTQTVKGATDCLSFFIATSAALMPFPELVACLDCGFAEFRIEESEPASPRRGHGREGEQKESMVRASKVSRRLP